MPLYRFESIVDLPDDAAAYAMSAELQEVAFEYVNRSDEGLPMYATVVTAGYSIIPHRPDAPQPRDRKGEKLQKKAKKLFRKGGQL